MILADKLGEDHRLPDVGTLDYLWEAWIDAGRVMHTGMGDAPLSWTEISHFAERTGAIDEAWEFRTIHAMSADYLSARQAGEEPLAMSPVEQLERSDD